MPEGLVVEKIENQTNHKNKAKKDKKSEEDKIMIIIEFADPLGRPIKRGFLVEFF